MGHALDVRHVLPASLKGAIKGTRWPDRFSPVNRCSATVRSAWRAIPCGAPAPQLRAAITQRLSREHADLLAIPEADPSGRRIDWYAPFDGEVRRLADLGESERDSIAATVQRLHGDLATLAESMEAPQRSGAERNFARLLRNALTAPGEETLYVVDGKPVMTFWGFSADAALPGAFLPSAPVVPLPIAPAAAAAAAAPEAVLASAPALAPAIVVERATWWQWLLLALLLLLLLAGLAYLLRPYLPHLEPRLEAEARDRALEFSVRQPVELQQRAPRHAAAGQREAAASNSRA